MMETETALDRLLRLKDVLLATGLSRSTLYSMIQDGEFPQQVKLTRRTVAWRASDIRAWQASRSVKNPIDRAGATNQSA